MAIFTQVPSMYTQQGIDRKLKDITHPEYNSMSLNWVRWRICYSGGRPFVWQFLERFEREGRREFEKRRNMSPSPTFAKAAINEVANAIFQRLADVVRKGGSSTYQSCVAGLDGGVDLKSSSLNAFIGRYVLPELLIQGRCGIWIDNEYLPESPTLAQVGNRHPYLYAYRAEDIRNWVYLEGPRQGEFQSILLCDAAYQLDDNTQLPTTKVENYRHAYIDPETGYVNVVTENYAGFRRELVLKVNKIPFIMLELSQSLMKDIDGHQIALLNMLSADVSYATKSNYPFYVEQYDHRTTSPYLRPAQPKGNRSINTGAPVPPGSEISPDGVYVVTPAGQAAQAAEAKPEEIVLGAGAARRYARDLNAPQFIHPSPEPLMASMQLRQDLKQQIRELTLLAVSSMDPKLASAESKQQDWRSLENGLSFIGLVLEQAERQLAERWAAYESSPVAEILYPEVWSLLSEDDRRKEADELKKQLLSVNSPTFRKQLQKQIVRLLVGYKVSQEILDVIFSEVDAAIGTTVEWDAVIADIEAGLISLATASTKIRGYPEGEVDKAATEHAERVARIAEAQGLGKAQKDPAAGGVADLSADPKSGESERNQDEQKRGKGQKPDAKKGKPS